MSDTKILTVETNFTQWLNLSTILLTASLVFYHLTKVKSLNIPQKIAGILSTCIIITNIIFTINSIIPYYTREKIKKGYEKIYHNVYFYTSIFFVFIEILICYFIIRDSFF
jgi:uncharacterized membrane protein YidH (DUF202 family)